MRLRSMPVLAGLGLTLGLAASAAPAQRGAAVPPGWSADSSGGACTIGNGTIRLAKVGVERSQDIFGRGYANTNNGIIVDVPGWPSVYGDEKILVRLPGQARYRAARRQLGNGSYFILWSEGQWFRELRNNQQIELEPDRGRGGKTTIRWSQPEMMQASRWLDTCRV